MSNDGATWVPLSRRAAGLGADETLYEGTPPHLRTSLEDWVLSLYRGVAFASTRDFLDTLLQTIQARMRWSRKPADPRKLDDEALLDLIDALLAFTPPKSIRFMTEYGSDPVAMLDAFLGLAGSAWCVAVGGDGLERRVDPTVAAAVQATISNAPQEASQHLAAAWSRAYGRDPDPDKAYDEAVLAVEALACPLVCPTNPRRTLGRVITDLESQAGQWELDFGDKDGNPAQPEPLIAMLKLLWQGQSRHAGSANSRSQTKAEGEAAVHLAATVVQWLHNNVLRKKR